MADQEKVVMSISESVSGRLSFSRKASPFFPSKLKMEHGQSEAAAQGDFLGLFELVFGEGAIGQFELRYRPEN